MLISGLSARFLPRLVSLCVHIAFGSWFLRGANANSINIMWYRPIQSGAHSRFFGCHFMGYLCFLNVSICRANFIFSMKFWWEFVGVSSFLQRFWRIEEVVKTAFQQFSKFFTQFWSGNLVFSLRMMIIDVKLALGAFQRWKNGPRRCPWCRVRVRCISDAELRKCVFYRFQHLYWQEPLFSFLKMI